MNLQDVIGGLINQVGGKTGAPIGAALSGLESDKVGEMVGDSAQEMNPDQRSQMMGSLLSGLSSSGVDLSSLLGQLGINPGVAANPEQATPDDVAAIAEHAHENHPGVFQSAMSFYEAHPTMIKTLGAVAVAAIANHVSNSGKEA